MELAEAKLEEARAEAGVKVAMSMGVGIAEAHDRWITASDRLRQIAWDVLA